MLFEYGKMVRSLSFTPIWRRFRMLVKVKPLMASAWPRASMGSRSAPSTLTHFTLLASILFASAKAGNSLREASPTGAAMVLPSRSFGVLMPLFFSTVMLCGGVLYTMYTATSFWPGLRALNSIMALMSPKPRSYVPEAILFTASPEPKPRSMVTFRPFAA